MLEIQSSPKNRLIIKNINNKFTVFLERDEKDRNYFIYELKIIQKNYGKIFYKVTDSYYEIMNLFNLIKEDTHKFFLLNLGIIL